MDVLVFKVLAVLVIFITGILGGLVPMRIGISGRADRLLMLGNAFAGGIFLGAGLIHMLTDAGVNMQAFAGDIDFPVVPLLCGAGFLIVFFIEKVLVGGDDVGGMAGGRPAIYPYVLTLILAVHSLIAGASLGLEKAMGASMVIFIAIIAHKGSASFALGISLKDAGMSPSRTKRLIAFFCCMTPLGILVGAAFSAVLSSKTAFGAEAVFDALAAGTFIYVGVLEIIEDVFADAADRWPKFILLAAAFGFMALLAVWT